MALVNYRDMLAHAYENQYAIGAIDLVSLDFLEAVVEAAEVARAPIILSVAEPHFAHYDFELMLPAVEAAAHRASVPVAIQLDQGQSIDSVLAAIRLGCNGVMLDACGQDLLTNIKATSSLVQIAGNCGVLVAGELGSVPDVDREEMDHGEVNDPNLTLPAEAKAYVERTGVDCLAVSIGTVQGQGRVQGSGQVKPDFKRLRRLHEVVKIPLEIHGGSSLNEAQFRRLSAFGVAKINYYTSLSDRAAQVIVNKSSAEQPTRFTDLKKGVKEAIGEEVQMRLRQWGSAGRAAEVLAQCAAWENVERVVVFELPSGQDTEQKGWLEEVAQTLMAIPCVRDVRHGPCIASNTPARYTLRLRLAHKQSLTSLEDHPGYADFIRRIHPKVTGIFDF